MKKTASRLKFILSTAACLCLPRIALCDPSSTYANIQSQFSVSYEQTTSGAVINGALSHSINLNVGAYGDFDPATYMPTSASFSGSSLLPGGQVDLAIPYNASAAVASGTSYFAVAGGGTFGVAPNAGAYMFGSGGVWSTDFSEVQGPLSVTLHDGAWDGMVFTGSSFDANLMPNTPFLDAASLSALENAQVNQALAMSFINPLSPSLVAYWGLQRIVGGVYSALYYQPLDTTPNMNGFTIPAGIILQEGDYQLYIVQSTPSPTNNDELQRDHYSSATYTYFSVNSPSVPDSGTTIAMLGLAVAGLACLRRRFAT